MAKRSVAFTLNGEKRQIEVRPDERDIQAARRRAEDKRDGAHRASGLAGAVADAVRGIDQRRFAANDAEHGLLGTGPHAGRAADAEGLIDDGMQGGGLGKPGVARFPERRFAAVLLAHQDEDIPYDQPPDRKAIGQDRTGEYD